MGDRPAPRGNPSVPANSQQDGGEDKILQPRQPGPNSFASRAREAEEFRRQGNAFWQEKERRETERRLAQSQAPVHPAHREPGTAFTRVCGEPRRDLARAELSPGGHRVVGLTQHTSSEPQAPEIPARHPVVQQPTKPSPSPLPLPPPEPPATSPSRFEPGRRLINRVFRRQQIASTTSPLLPASLTSTSDTATVGDGTTIPPKAAKLLGIGTTESRIESPQQSPTSMMRRLTSARKMTRNRRRVEEAGKQAYDEENINVIKNDPSIAPFRMDVKSHPFSRHAPPSETPNDMLQQNSPRSMPTGAQILEACESSLPPTPPAKDTPPGEKALRNSPAHHPPSEPVAVPSLLRTRAYSNGKRQIAGSVDVSNVSPMSAAPQSASSDLVMTESVEHLSCGGLSDALPKPRTKTLARAGSPERLRRPFPTYSTQHNDVQVPNKHPKPEITPGSSNESVSQLTNKSEESRISIDSSYPRLARDPTFVNRQAYRDLGTPRSRASTPPDDDLRASELLRMHQALVNSRRSVQNSMRSRASSVYSRPQDDNSKPVTQTQPQHILPSKAYAWSAARGGEHSSAVPSQLVPSAGTIFQQSRDPFSGRMCDHPGERAAMRRPMRLPSAPLPPHSEPPRHASKAPVTGSSGVTALESTIEQTLPPPPPNRPPPPPPSEHRGMLREIRAQPPSHRYRQGLSQQRPNQDYDIIESAPILRPSTATHIREAGDPIRSEYKHSRDRRMEPFVSAGNESGPNIAGIKPTSYAMLSSLIEQDMQEICQNDASPSTILTSNELAAQLQQHTDDLRIFFRSEIDRATVISHRMLVQYIQDEAARRSGSFMGTTYQELDATAQSGLDELGEVQREVQRLNTIVEDRINRSRVTGQGETAVACELNKLAAVLGDFLQNVNDHRAQLGRQEGQPF